MSKEYLRCVDAAQTNLTEGKVYLCDSIKDVNGNSYYCVWDKVNRYMGTFIAERFQSVAKKDKHSIESFNKKFKEYQSTKKKLKRLREELNRQYKWIGEQLNLNLK